MIKNRIALVTGAKKGIGLAVSKKLLNSGYTVVMTDCEEISKDYIKLERLLKEKQERRRRKQHDFEM